MEAWCEGLGVIGNGVTLRLGFDFLYGLYWKDMREHDIDK